MGRMTLQGHPPSLTVTGQPANHNRRTDDVNSGYVVTTGCKVARLHGYIVTRLHRYKVTEETVESATTPECARPRAQQRRSGKKPRKMGSRRQSRSLLRPRTGALRCRLPSGLGSTLLQSALGCNDVTMQQCNNHA